MTIFAFQRSLKHAPSSLPGMPGILAGANDIGMPAIMAIFSMVMDVNFQGMGSQSMPIYAGIIYRCKDIVQQGVYMMANSELIAWAKATGESSCKK